MYREKFDKVEFQKTVKSNVKRLYRKTVEEATQQQLFPGSVLCGKGCYHRQMDATHRNNMKKMTQKPYTICPWNF